MAAAAQRQLAQSRIKFLDTASHYLVQSCPSVSSHLQLDLSDVALNTEQELPLSKKHEACGACGTIYQSQTSKVYLDSRSQKAESDNMKSARVISKSLVTECLVCGNKTRSSLPRSQRSKTSRIETPLPIPSPSVSAPKTSFEGEAKVSRKQKQKEKRKQGSLQEMLAKSKNESKASSSLGLSLMDLMKGT
jgi:RNase P subunit RPR2